MNAPRTAYDIHRAQHEEVTLSGSHGGLADSVAAQNADVREEETPRRPDRWCSVRSPADAPDARELQRHESLRAWLGMLEVAGGKPVTCANIVALAHGRPSWGHIFNTNRHQMV